MWQRWFEAGKARPVRLGSFSYKMKGSEPISDNQLRWITKPTQISRLTCKIGKGSYGSVYLVGFRDVALGKELGMEEVVSYVAKKCDAVGTNTAWVMMHKELASFAETHCAIVRPIACHNIEAEPILVMPTWEDDRSLVFAALGDLGMAQQVHVAASDNGVKYNHTDPVERDWIAPELVNEKIRELARTGIMIRPVNEYNKATDVYALGVLTQKVCGDFFTDMTNPEWKAYNDKYYDAGADI
ncbi:hypothetical protein R1sor_005885 [Riccia sorocarpa]|uniref:Protein kinase domain-containing protein n=1 Tax=Riccia sorocarpa TaxID=122646 RepID=A0ABD3HPI2_9MARC